MKKSESLLIKCAMDMLAVELDRNNVPFFRDKGRRRIAVRLNDNEHIHLMFHKYSDGVGSDTEVVPILRLRSFQSQVETRLDSNVAKWRTKDVSPRTELSFLPCEFGAVVSWFLDNATAVKKVPSFIEGPLVNCEVGELPGYLWTKKATAAYDRHRNDGRQPLRQRLAR